MEKRFVASIRLPSLANPRHETVPDSRSPHQAQHGKGGHEAELRATPSFSSALGRNSFTPEGFPDPVAGNGARPGTAWKPGPSPFSPGILMRMFGGGRVASGGI
jgi:hypothetical protein